MPIYEYECANCGHTLDALEKISDKPQRKCPECSRLKLKRLVSAPKFRLAGAGWYETDFKTDNQRNLAGDKSDSAKGSAKDGGNDSAKSADKKGDSKPKPAAADKKSGAKADSKSSSAAAD